MINELNRDPAAPASKNNYGVELKRPANHLVGLKRSHEVSSVSMLSKDKCKVILFGRVSFYWIENSRNVIKTRHCLQSVSTLCWFSFLLSCLIVCPFIPLRCSLGCRVHRCLLQSPRRDTGSDC